MSDGHVTRNFKRSEFACKCGCEKGYYVSPELAKILQFVRDRVAAPLIITSGLRCPEHNKASGGAKESYHLHRSGILLAADVTYAEREKRTVMGMMKLHIITSQMLTSYGPEGGGGLGLYKRWIHVDVRMARSARWIDKDWKFL